MNLFLLKLPRPNQFKLGVNSWYIMVFYFVIHVRLSISGAL